VADSSPIAYTGPSRRVSTADGRFVFERGVPVDVPEPVRSRLLEQATFTEVRGTGKTRKAERSAAAAANAARVETEDALAERE
jgi:hypothetical protein